MVQVFKGSECKGVKQIKLSSIETPCADFTSSLFSFLPYPASCYSGKNGVAFIILDFI